MDLGNLQVIPLQGLAPRKIPGVPDQSPGPDRNLGLDPEEVLGGIIQGHDLGPGPIEDLVADLTAEIIEDGRIDDFIKDKYASFNKGIGERIVQGETTLEELSDYACGKRVTVNPDSGRQEYLQTILNQILF